MEPDRLMRAFVTGASGFVGGHLARALVRRGAEVRCLVRAASRVDQLSDLPLELVRGDLTDAATLDSAVRGVDIVFHCAADYRLWVPQPAPMYAVNVEGTRNVLRAAAEAGVRRVVYTSSVGALGLAGPGRVADERTAVAFADMIGHYKKSKYLAEREAEAWAARGLPVVIVNPSTPVGELDVKPTATGQMIVDFLDGRMPAYVETGLNLIDVRDVAEGHLLAAEHGRPGEKYILGHENLTLKQLLELLAAIAGIPAPRLRLPHWVPLTVSAVDSWLARPFGRVPRVPLDAVRLSRKTMFFDSSKAVRELGLRCTPIEGALARAVEWFREHGYVRRDRSRASSGPEKLSPKPGFGKRPVLILVALDEELAPLVRRTRVSSRVRLGDARVVRGRLGRTEVVLARTGDGHARAAAGAAAVLERFPAGLVIALGTCGGLDPALAAGTIVVARRIQNGTGAPTRPDPGWVEHALGRGAVGATVLCPDRILSSPAAKARARAGIDAVGPAVVDLESAAYAEAAERHGAACLVLRVVLDPADEALPLDLDRLRDERGSVRRARVLGQALAHPAALGGLLRLRRRLDACAETLAQFVSGLVDAEELHAAS